LLHSDHGDGSELFFPAKKYPPAAADYEKKPYLKPLDADRLRTVRKQSAARAKAPGDNPFPDKQAPAIPV